MITIPAYEILIEEKTGREFSMPDTMDQHTFEGHRSLRTTVQ
ncbi:MAG TPA: hypothetical protein VMB51_01620 [Solirubrobacteraceae bacterium]|nr:hypothetical protein [Solirubrobacteraceae bacterium]